MRHGEDISIYKEGDAFVWVPVAKRDMQGNTRAFLPHRGLDYIYTYGYKAQPSEGSYFEALKSIQKAYIEDESNTFITSGKPQGEKQRKDKWHWPPEKRSVLGSSLGWVKIPVSEIESIDEQELGDALLSDGERHVELSRQNTSIEPILCSSYEELLLEASQVLETMDGKIPKGQQHPEVIETNTKQLKRDAAVVAYILKEAHGSCECCGKPSPFLNERGEPFLEVHHVKHLSEQGSDTIYNAVGICPNCHRELHYGTNKAAIRELLYSKVERLIQE